MARKPSSARKPVKPTGTPIRQTKPRRATVPAPNTDKKMIVPVKKSRKRKPLNA